MVKLVCITLCHVCATFVLVACSQQHNPEFWGENCITVHCTSCPQLHLLLVGEPLLPSRCSMSVPDDEGSCLTSTDEPKEGNNFFAVLR